MRWKFWQADEASQPAPSEEAPPPRLDLAPQPAPEPVDAAPVQHLEPALEPEPEPEPEAPGHVTLTIDEAKGVIKEAGGDVIQVGFLASAYRRNLEDDPASAETVASRKRLRELVGKRLKDRGLLASDGIVELRE